MNQPAARSITARNLASMFALLAACGTDDGTVAGSSDAAAPDTVAAADTPAPADTSLADTAPADTAPADTAPAGPCAIDGLACDDGDDCTFGDRCLQGACQAGVDLCACRKDADCAGTGNLCDGAPLCDTAKAPYACKIKPFSAVNCDDSLDTLCSKNTCDPKTGSCAAKPAIDGTPCQDGDPCSADDGCLAGSCEGGATKACQCQNDADCNAFDDGNPCTGTLYCDKKGWPAHTCRVNPATVIVCDDSADTACLKNACKASDGGCAKLPVEQLIEVCAPGKGCGYSEAGGPGKPPACDDGDPCSSGDVCAAGACKAGPTNACACSKDADCDGKEDGDLCNGTLYCDVKSASCKLNPATVISCPSVADTACMTNVCVPATGQCVFGPVKNGKPCDDGDPCTGGDLCLGGGCGGPTNVCACQGDADCKGKDDGNLCNGIKFCDKSDGLCKHNPASMVSCPSVNDSACSKNACDPAAGACKPTPIERSAVICDLPPTTLDGKPGCRRELLPAAAEPTGPHGCDDGDSCTAGDLCAKGACQPGTYACFCQSDADCQDDGNLCNGVPFCDKTDPTKPTCKNNPATVKTCPTGNDTACIKTQCQPLSGQCQKVLVGDGSGCDDGTACTADDFCLLGACKPGKLVCACMADSDCFDVDGNACNGVPYCDKTDPAKPVCKPNPASVVYCPKGADSACLKNSCDPKTGACGLQPLPSGTGCDDGSACTNGDGCSGGDCVGKALSCDDSKQCTLDACDAKDGCVHSAKNCSDGNDCTLDVCDAKTGACLNDKASLAGKPCNADGDGCTVADACKDGACKAGGAPKCSVSGGECDAPTCVSTGANTFQCVLVAAADGAPCADGASCQVGAACKGGKCQGGGEDTLGFVTWTDAAGAVALHRVTATADGALASGRRVGGDGKHAWLLWRLSASGKVLSGWPIELAKGQTSVQAVVAIAGDALELLATLGGTTLAVRVLAPDGKTAIVSKDLPNFGSVRHGIADGAGGWYLAGASGLNGRVSRVTAAATLAWNSGGPGVWYHGLAPRKDGSVVAAGRLEQSSNSGGSVVALEPTKGSVLWHHGTTTTAASRALVAAAVDGDDLPVLAGYASVGGADRPWIVALDAAGKERWQRTGTEAMRINAWAPRGKGWVAAGAAPGSGGTDAALLALDAAGAPLWLAKRTGLGADAAFDVSPAAGHSYLAAGYAAATAPAEQAQGMLWHIGTFGHDSCAKAGTCYGKAANACDDGEVCTDDGCDGASGCKATSNAAPCQDGDACSAGDTCLGGVCKAGTPTVCADQNPCTKDVCDGKAGCVFDPVADMTPCGDGKSCFAGVCAKRWALDVAAHLNGGLALAGDGTVWAWGNCGAYTSPCGNPSYPTPQGTPIKTNKVKNLVMIASEREHACAIDVQQQIWCWGRNYSGEVGIGAITNYETTAEIIVAAPDAVDVDVGYYLTCAVNKAGEVLCWGANEGLSAGKAPANVPVPTPNKVSGFASKATAVAVGDSHACALLADKTVACWGSNESSMLGNAGVKSATATAVVVEGLSDVVQLESAYRHTCARRGDGTLWCWGLNDYGQLGDGTKASTAKPVAVYKLQGVVDFDLGYRSTCAVLQDGSVRCWGENVHGKLGTGDTFHRITPEPMVGISKALRVGVGSNHTCVALQSGEVRCVGYNHASILGLGHNKTPVLTPEPVYGSAP